MTILSEVILREAIAVSKFKIEWANQHIGALKPIIEGIIAENTDVVRIDNDSNPARITIGPNQALPIELFLHLGDAVHNLNSVTDYLWTALDRSAHEVLGRAIDHATFGRTSFPRHAAWDDLATDIEKAIANDAAIYVAFPQAKRFILHTIKPCKRANDPAFVWTLNKIDNINKHRFLLATAYVISFDRDFELIGRDGGRIIHERGAGLQTQGEPLLIALTPPVKLDGEPEPIVDVVFGEPKYFTREPILETLGNLTNAIAELLKSFEEAFL